MSGPSTQEARLEEMQRRAREHRHRLISSKDANLLVHGSRILQRINSKIALGITLAVGSMWAAYAFATLAFVSLPSAVKSGDPVILVSWISQTFLQLVLLSIIMVGQQVLSTASDARAEADHETLDLLHQINTVQLELLQENQRVNAQLLELVDSRSKRDNG